MSVRISPLALLLDNENPRFVVLNNREQSDIRKYLVTYEDVCDLATGINNYGGILPGERIVAMQRGENYVVIEGNRRTCSLQLLLNPELIPDGFRHRIPVATDLLKTNCESIEIDTVPNREAALELMAKRHIEGVKQWKPLAKKQFFAANYALGRSVSNLSSTTGIPERTIKADIRDYKLFLAAYNRYCADHPDYQGQIIDLKIDPFLRIFKAKFNYNGAETTPTDLLRITYTDDFDATSELPGDAFRRIVQIIFEQATITERINTRNTLADVTEVIAILDEIAAQTPDPEEPPPTPPTPGGPAPSGPTPGGPTPGGPTPGGPAPSTFFEALSWDQKLSPHNPEHAGLLVAVHELYALSTTQFGRRRAYEMFPITTGMILRTSYEQALRMRLRKTRLWGTFMQTVQPPGSFPTLSAMESFIDNPAYKSTVLPTTEMESALSLIIRHSHRDFLNANIHNPGDIRVTPESLVALAQGGMFTLIQGCINYA